MNVRLPLRWLGRSLRCLLVSLLLVGLGFYLHYLWSGPALKPWHRARLTAEFTAHDYKSGRVTTLDQYRAQERRVMDQVRTEVYGKLASEDRSPINRYDAGSRSDPRTWATDWNRTFVMEPRGTPVAGAVVGVRSPRATPMSFSKATDLNATC
jgi:hypothetical protein